MAQVKMDASLSIYGDMIRFKEDAATQKVKLGNAELENVAYLKNSFYELIIGKLGIDVNKQKFSVDIINKIVTVEDREPEKV